MMKLTSLDAAVRQACATIAPAWPLDRQIAVNPWWSFIDRPFSQAAAELARISGAQLVWPDDEASGEPVACGLPLPADVLEAVSADPGGPGWSEVITQQVSQYCASHFDAHQSDWRRPRSAGLYSGWRESLAMDHALESLMHAPQVRERARNLPEEPDAAIAWALDRLEVEESAAALFLQACLWRIGGWASWCAYLSWEAGLRAGEDAHLRELLAIRVCWEALLLDDPAARNPAREQWRGRWHEAIAGAGHWPVPEGLAGQRAREIAWQRHLTGLLESRMNAPATAVTEPETVLVFCIDVRSERLRRALEGLDGSLATRGFAGFFGMPIRFTPLGTGHGRALLPGLIAPTVEATESCGNAQADLRIEAARHRQMQRALARRPFAAYPTGSFTSVEMLGITRVAGILQRGFGLLRNRTDATGLRPCLQTAGDDTVKRDADLAAAALRGMGLTGHLPRLLVLVGHGSQSANNPQAAALDCGACGGHGGETNAAVLAQLLNDPAVRTRLGELGICIREDMLAVAALHNTTTDEVTLLPPPDASGAHEALLQRLRGQLAQAGHLTRRERAADLGLASLADSPERLLHSLRRRARDWSQTRPEWGLAGNAAFIIAARERTRGLDLAGRVFLHDYDAAGDADGSVLELIMTAPMIVTHWINMQYNASTVDPRRFGSGNKVLHNVACGRIGVFEGNTGDLRIGLARQSVHDGTRWMHEPLRLTVCIDAPQPAIERVIARHAMVRNLVENEWLYLLRFGEKGMQWRRQGEWVAWSPNR